MASLQDMIAKEMARNAQWLQAQRQVDSVTKNMNQKIATAPTPAQVQDAIRKWMRS